MQDKSSPDAFLINGVSCKKVLLNWLMVTADFQSNYNSLVKCLNAYNRQQNSPKYGKLYAGQFSIGQLVSLLNTMQQELERLVIDIDQYHEPDPANQSEYYIKLANHTQTIRELNRQANALLQLATMPLSRQ